MFKLLTSGGRVASLLLCLDAQIAGNVRAADAPPLVPALSAVEEEVHEWHARRSEYVRRTWGVSIDGVRSLSSGFMLEFRYTVVDPHKAEALQIKTVKPFIIDESTNVRLSVPAMENIGELRQTAAPEAGHSYYVIFGNPGRLVKRGGHVTVVIGEFRVPGLVVQ